MQNLSQGLLNKFELSYGVKITPSRSGRLFNKKYIIYKIIDKIIDKIISTNINVVIYFNVCGKFNLLIHFNCSLNII